MRNRVSPLGMTWIQFTKALGYQANCLGVTRVRTLTLSRSFHFSYEGF
jgi:hypothetical protein